MSLLIKALKQAERRHHEALQQVASESAALDAVPPPATAEVPAARVHEPVVAVAPDAAPVAAGPVDDAPAHPTPSSASLASGTLSAVEAVGLAAAQAPDLELAPHAEMPQPSSWRLDLADPATPGDAPVADDAASAAIAVATAAPDMLLQPIDAPVVPAGTTADAIAIERTVAIEVTPPVPDAASAATAAGEPPASATAVADLAPPASATGAGPQDAADAPQSDTVVAPPPVRGSRARGLFASLWPARMSAPPMSPSTGPAPAATSSPAPTARRAAAAAAARSAPPIAADAAAPRPARRRMPSRTALLAGIAAAVCGALGAAFWWEAGGFGGPQRGVSVGVPPPPPPVEPTVAEQVAAPTRSEGRPGGAGPEAAPRPAPIAVATAPAASGKGPGRTATAPAASAPAAAGPAATDTSATPAGSAGLSARADRATAPARAADATGGAARNPPVRADASPNRPTATHRAVEPTRAAATPRATERTRASAPPRAAEPTQAAAASAPATTAPPTTAPDAPRFVRSSSPEAIAALLAQAYATASKSAPAARALYEQVLKLDRSNVDALNGLATLAARDGDAVGAERLWRRVLDVDPNDAGARAGLVTLLGPSDSGSQESHLRVLLAADATDPALHYALGNVLAAQSRWAEAQQAFFAAVAGDPEQPDYLYNLAVSLERIRQPQAALPLYTKALEAAQRRAARFDPTAARGRIAAIQALRDAAAAGAAAARPATAPARPTAGAAADGGSAPASPPPPGASTTPAEAAPAARATAAPAESSSGAAALYTGAQ